MVALWNAFGQAGVEVGEVYADGEHAAGIVEVSAGAAGKVRQATIFHMNADGKVAELWGMPSDSAIASAVATGEPVPAHPNVADVPRAPRRRGSAASSGPRTRR